MSGMEPKLHGLTKEDSSHHLSAHDGVQFAQQTVARMKKIIASPMGKRKQNGAAAYGVPLGELMIQAGRVAVVPVVMDKLIDFITKHGLDEQGLFRVSGSAKVVEKIKTMFDRGGDIDLEQFMGDLSAVAGALKQFLRELPEPLIPSYQHSMFIRGSKKCDGCDDKLVEELKSLVAILPLTNRNILKYLCSFLDTVAEHEHNNKMNAKGLGIVFGPNVFRCTMEGMEGLQEQTCTNVIVEKFVSRYEEIFGEPPSASAYHKSEVSSPMSPVGGVLRVKPQVHASSPPNKPKPYRQYKADKQEASSSPKHGRHSSDGALERDDDSSDVNHPMSPKRSLSLEQADDGRPRRMNRWVSGGGNGSSPHQHHGRHVSAPRSPGVIRRVYLDKSLERDKTDSANGDGALLTVPNGIGLSALDNDGRADSPWSPSGSVVTTPVPDSAVTPTSNALIDEVIENTIREKLLGMSIGDDGDESAIGSLGSGSIHHFSGEDMAEIMAPGSRYGDGSQDTSTGSSRLFVPRKHSAADGSPDSNSEEDDVALRGNHRPGRATIAEITSAIPTIQTEDVSRHDAAQPVDSFSPSRRSGSVETTLSVGREAQATRGMRSTDQNGRSIAEEGTNMTGDASDTGLDGSQKKKERPAVPQRPKGRKPSVDGDTPDGAIVSTIRGPGRKFDEVTENAEVLKPLTRERPAGPPRRNGSLSRKGRERLASIPSMNAADGVGHHNGSGDLHLHNQPTTLLDLASTCTLNPNDDMPPPVDPNALSYSIVNGVRVRRRKKRVPVTTQLRMSVSKDEKTQRISLSFDVGNQTARNNAAEDCNGGNTAARNNAAENCNVENTTARNISADDSDKADNEGPPEQRRSTMPDGVKQKRHLPNIPAEKQRMSQSTSPSPENMSTANGHDAKPYAIVMALPGLSQESRTSREDLQRPTTSSSSSQGMDDFVYQCKVPTPNEYERMDVPEIGTHVHELKEVAHRHDKLFFERFKRKAHQPDRMAIRNVIVSLAAAKKRLEGLKKEQAEQATLNETRPSTSNATPRQDPLASAANSYRGPTPISSPSPEAAPPNDRDTNNSAPNVSRESPAFSLSTGTEAAVEEVWKAVLMSRRAAGRPSDIFEMTGRELTDEKHAVQKQLLKYESAFGRPKTGEERRLLKPVYEHYKVLKREIERKDISPDAFESPPTAIQSLSGTMLEDGDTFDSDAHAKAFRSTANRGRIMSDRIGQRSPSPVASGERDNLSRSLPVASATDHLRSDKLAKTSVLGGGREGATRKGSTISEAPISSGWMGDLKLLNRIELLEQFKAITDSKQRVKRKLKQYEEDFFQRTGRRVGKEDRGAFIDDYEEYKHAKAKLRVIEGLLAKVDTRSNETC
eukprot:scpid13536/ scgid5772/ Protein FAM13A